jgi:hypothetical protein
LEFGEGGRTVKALIASRPLGILSGLFIC